MRPDVSGGRRGEGGGGGSSGRQGGGGGGGGLMSDTVEGARRMGGESGSVGCAMVLEGRGGGGVGWSIDVYLQ